MKNLDLRLMDLLNFDGGPFLDNLMWFISEKVVWVPLYLLLVWLTMRAYGWRKGLIYILFIIAGVGLADQLCNLLKDGFQFLRPTHTPGVAENLHSVRGYVGGKYGTASAHAALSLVVLLMFGHSIVGRGEDRSGRTRRLYYLPMTLWLLLVCWSRVYLGAHFPSQILFGLIVGTLISLLLIVLFNRFISPRIER